jgi:HAD superfamily hydrolase (TIGR01549 family)
MNQCAIFDFADTLAVQVPSRLTVVTSFIEKVTGLQISEASIARAYGTLDATMPYSSIKVRSASDREAFFRSYNARLLLFLGVSHLVNPVSLFDAFSTQEMHWQLKPEAKDVLQCLRSLGWRVGVISNFDTRLEQLIQEKLGISHLVDYLFVSQREGLEKPDPNFFRLFCDRYCINIGKSFYVGDSFLLDYLPALQVGLRTLLLDEHRLYEHLPDGIHSLRDIFDKVRAGV